MQSHLEFPVIDLVGKTGISELLGVSNTAPFLSATIRGQSTWHAAAGVRTVGLFFSTAYFAETAPYGAGHAVLQSELPCSPCHVDQICDNPICRDAITVDAVEAAVEKMLGYRPAWGLFPRSFGVYLRFYPRRTSSVCSSRTRVRFGALPEGPGIPGAMGQGARL